MGLTPRDVDRMSVWEYRSCLDAWNRAHGSERDGGDPDAISDERLAALGVEGFA